MTIKRKLIISNILMFIIPIIAAVLMVAGTIEVFDSQAASVIRFYEDGNGAFDAQIRIYTYRSELSKEKPELSKFDIAMKSAGYHYVLTRDNKETFSTLTKEDISKIGSSADTLSVSKNALITGSNQAIIKSTFRSKGHVTTVTAISTDMERSGHAVQKNIVFKSVLFLVLFLLILLSVIVLTNLMLTRLIQRSILRPLSILSDGSRRIADGDLDSPICWKSKDEFGKAAADFDSMRMHLKKLVADQLKYEEYRKELLIGISHDLRTPLTSIKGYAEGLMDGIADNEEKKQRYYKAIHMRAEDMNDLVDSLSVLGKLENSSYVYKMEKTEIDAFLSDIAEDYSEGRDDISIELDLELSNEAVSLDIQGMKRVFQNIFENSRKYSERENTVIKIIASSDSSHVNITVKDNGPGIRSEDLPHIFESFYRGDRSRSKSGNGLGLAIVKSIIEGHHGTVKAYNNGGLELQIKIPLLKEGVRK